MTGVYRKEVGCRNPFDIWQFSVIGNMKLRFRTLRLGSTVVCAALLLITTGARSQTSRSPDTSNQRPALGASPGVAIPPTSSAEASGALTPRHRSPTGAVCMRVVGMARPFSNNSNLFNHWIYAENICSDRIRLRVCYFSTTSCITMDVAGRERKEAILGTLPSVKDFRYEYRERF